MVGAVETDPDYAIASLVLQGMGKNIFPCGGAGTG